MLVVIAILVILAALSIPAVSVLLKARTFDQTLATMSGNLEQARQYAVAQNTYVWVAFATSSTNVDMAVIASPDGTDTSPTWSGTVAAGSSTLIPVARIQTFGYTTLVSPNGASGSRTVNPATAPSTVGQPLNNSTASFSVNLPSQSAATSFNYALQFTPSGQARIQDGAPVDFIEFALQPQKAAGVVNAADGAVLQVNGLTGQTRVYRQ
jgi:Tfp pilus assembly protein PilE